jgi:monofunctional biosynthetic peptidoglycan transglycosylase
MVVDFNDAAAAREWLAVNDNVMGGVSDGRFDITEDGTLAFFGSVSLENNGGFASIRWRTPSLNLSSYDGLHLRLRGDGKRYALSVRTDYPIVAGSYYADFETRLGQWQDVFLAFDAFKARSFGRPLLEAPRLNTLDIRGIGFIISDKQTGPFRLEVDWMKAVRVSEAQASGGQVSPASGMVAPRDLIHQAINRGAPLFNAGQAEACAAIYEMTARCMVRLAKDELPPLAWDSLAQGLEKAEQERDAGARAWALRHALDGALGALDHMARSTRMDTAE